MFQRSLQQFGHAQSSTSASAVLVRNAEHRVRRRPLKMTTLVGIIGKRQSGKSTVGQIMHNQHGWHQLELCTPLKKACAAMFGLTEEQLNDSAEKERQIPQLPMLTPRDILQHVGTEWGRNQMHNLIPYIGKDFWIWRLQREIATIVAKQPYAKIVITDVRFQNEIDYIRARGGMIVGVVRQPPPGEGQTDRTAAGAEVPDQEARNALQARFESHESERLANNVAEAADLILVNSGERVHTLHGAVREMLDNL